MATEKWVCPGCAPGAATKNAQKDSEKPTFIVEGTPGPYVPGMIKPPVKKVHPKGAPPRYLPQPTDTVSGDILTMGPVGPWAPGHMDWSPTAGSTGVRPVVEKYSITKYSTNQWRKNNQAILNPKAMAESKKLEKEIKDKIKDIDDKMAKKQAASNENLDKRVKEVEHWMKEVLKEQRAMDKETQMLEEYRVKLKGASRILMMPEAISKECIEIRGHRYEPDLVRDEAEQELIKEVAIVGEIRRSFSDLLAKVNEQLINNRAAKAAIEMDFDNKLTTLKEDRRNLSLTNDSSVLEKHPGVNRWVENGTTYEFWKHFVQESIKNCAEVRKKSADLRQNLMTTIVKGGEDIRYQSDRTNAALEDTVSTTEELCAKLEDYLKETLQKIADLETLIAEVMAKLRYLNNMCKLSDTRLHSRNYKRPNAENCQDYAQYALMDESKYVAESSTWLKDKLRELEGNLAVLMKYRGDLEKDIASKRKALNIDRDRFKMIRAHLPSPEEFHAG